MSMPNLEAPWQRIPLVHDSTDLFPTETMDALDARYVGGGGGTGSVPAGGSTGQVLTKDSGTDQDTSWQTPSDLVPDGGTALQVLIKDSGTDQDTSWATQLAIAAGSANNPHTTEGAARNSSLPKNFWQYTGDAGVDDPDNWIAGDEWISA